MITAIHKDPGPITLIYLLAGLTCDLMIGSFIYDMIEMLNTPVLGQ